MFPIKDLEDLEKLNELVSLQDQVKAVRLQAKLGNQKFHEGIKNYSNQLLNHLKTPLKMKQKTITETSFKDNQAMESLNKKLLEIENDRDILATYLMSPLSKITNPENASQFRLVKDSSSNRVNDLLIHNTIPITLNNNILTFHDTGKEIESKGDLLKMITNNNFNVDLASLSD